jgi:hypothetical protein
MKNPFRKFSYEWTVLEGMARYPTIFPSEFSMQHHLFIVNGNGLDWDKNGQLVCRIDGEFTKETIERTFDSILYKNPFIDDSYLFMNCGSERFINLYPYNREYSSFKEIFDYSIVPESSWCKGIINFCNKILLINKSFYKHFIQSSEVDKLKISSEMKNLNEIQKDATILLKRLCG